MLPVAGADTAPVAAGPAQAAVSYPMPGPVRMPPPAVSTAPVRPLVALPPEPLPRIAPAPPRRLRPLLAVGVLLAVALFVGAVVLSAVLLLNSRSGIVPAAGSSMDPTAAATLIQAQATALAAQETITARYNFQATQIAEQPVRAQATMTALSRAGVPGATLPPLQGAAGTATAAARATALSSPSTTPEIVP
ncbi:MAG: hypothetical protein M3Z04_20355 [Chloroflexota bacterium]|nr:hypothetical protein [Chloroflexota bacterium]